MRLGDRRCLLVTVFAGSVLYTLASRLGSTPYDDAYFFLRFARNFLSHGVFAWNPSDGPVHGNTSQLFQWVAVGLASVAPHHYVAASRLFLAACLAVAGSLLIHDAGRLTRSFDDGAALGLGVSTFPLILWTPETGMETALSLLLVTLALRPAALRPGQVATAIPSGLLTLAVYSCRPDAALLVATYVALSHAGDRRFLSVYAGSVALGLGVYCLALHAYYGTALPLPFYAKTLGLGPSDPTFRRLALTSKGVHAATLLAFAGPLLPFACVRSARARPYLGAAAVFLAYHVVFVEDIMGYRARFLAPALVPLTFAAAAGWDLLTPRRSARNVASWVVVWSALLTIAYAASWIEHGGGSSLERIPWVAYCVLPLVVAWLSLRPGADAPGESRPPLDLAIVVVASLVGVVVATPPRFASMEPDDAYVARSRDEVTTFRGLDDLERCLPGLRQLYHSEIGVPGIVFQDARVVDLAGLMSKEIALTHPAFDDYCLVDRPEVIFLPHKNYVLQNREIARSRCLRGYERMTRRSSSPLFVRADLAEAFRGCARGLERWQ